MPLQKIRLPHNGWRPREYQIPAWGYLENGGKRACLIWHRRSGKDDVCLHWAAISAHQRIGNYWHMLPEYSQGRKAIWTAVNSQTGKRRIDEAFPHDLRAATNDHEMFIRFKNGSTWQIVGSDRFNSDVGSAPFGITFSEWALSDPQSWGYLAPILDENNGWALFITTARGRNHAKSMLDMARVRPDWFAQVLAVTDTGYSLDKVERQRIEHHGIFGEEAGDALIEQEYFCSFEAAVLGAFWGKLIADAERAGRICDLEIDRAFPVQKAWDIGMDDPMAIVCFQVGHGFVNVVDYYESNGHGFDHYAEWLKERDYRGIDWVPHDAKQREPGAPSGRSRIQSMIAEGLRPKLCPDHRPIDRINAARQTIPLAKFDAKRCARLLECCREYKAEWNPDLRVFAKTAKHDWSCVTGDTIVLTRHVMRQIKDLPETGEVLTPCGWKEYRNPHITRRNAQLVEVKFIDGLTVRCTADHPFLTVNGWRYAANLQTGLEIQSSLMRQSNTMMEGYIGHFHRRIISRKAANIFISLCGRMYSGRFRKDATFIIGTKTLATIGSRIWNAFQLTSTFLSHGIAAMRKVFLRDSQTKLALHRLIGTSQMQVAYGIGDKQLDLNHGQNGPAKRSLAKLADSSFNALFVGMGTPKNSARITARPLLIESVKPLSVTADVWCLTVDDGHWWSLANGAVTHNSHGADAFGHMAVSWKQPMDEEDTKPIRGASEMTMEEAWRIAKPKQAGVGI